MLKRSVFFTNPYILILRNEQMVVQEKGTGVIVDTLPIEDLGYVLLENHQISISLPLLAKLSENNVAVVFCDAYHMPVSMLQNLDSNTIQSEIYKEQLKASVAFKKKLWKTVVECKIRNQAAVLRKNGRDGDVLKPLYNNVKTGDSDNREGVAAKAYWSLLLGDDFERDREGAFPNNMLNYGYTILRAAVARSLLGSGLYPAFGLFHRNRYNAFPLADDIMEPYRPYVDDLVLQIYKSGKTELDKQTKGELINLLYSDTSLNGATRPMQISITSTTASLARSFSDLENKLVFPIFS